MNFKRICSIASVVLVLIITPIGNASAQDSADEIVQYLPGIESAYARKYISAEELGFLLLGTLVASPEVETVAYISATVLEFKDEITLTATWAAMLKDDLVATIAGERELEFNVTRVDNLGDQALVALAEGEGGEATGVIIVQDGNLGLIVIGEGPERPLMQSMRNIASFRTCFKTSEFNA